MGKRAFDIVVAAGAILLTSPLLVTIAVAVRLDSGGAAVFTQERVGLDGKIFRIHKFRSMRTDVAGQLISPTHDPRITRVGKVLRKTKMDELLQLFDVLGGRMSLVGPRPEVAKYVAMWSEHDRRVILSIRPGITDPTSINYRNESDELAATADPERHYISSLLPRKAAGYVEYVQTRTFVGDLRILFRTVSSVIHPGSGRSFS